MFYWLLLAVAAAATMLRPPEREQLKTACRGRRKQDCTGECSWTVGDGCKDKDPYRYFAKGAFAEDDAKRKFCRCVLHLMAKDIKAPYAICAATTGTTTGGRPCQYDFSRIPMNEVRAYTNALVRTGKLKMKPSRMSDAELRGALQEWYEAGRAR